MGGQRPCYSAPALLSPWAGWVGKKLSMVRSYQWLPVNTCCLSACIRLYDLLPLLTEFTLSLSLYTYTLNTVHTHILVHLSPLYLCLSFLTLFCSPAHAHPREVSCSAIPASLQYTNCGHSTVYRIQYNAY